MTLRKNKQVWKEILYLDLAVMLNPGGVLDTKWHKHGLDETDLAGLKVALQEIRIEMERRSGCPINLRYNPNE